MGRQALGQGAERLHVWNVPICQGPEASSKVGDRKGWDNEQQGPREECLGKSKWGNRPCDFLERWDLMTGHRGAQRKHMVPPGPFPLGGRDGEPPFPLSSETHCSELRSRALQNAWQSRMWSAVAKRMVTLPPRTGLLSAKGGSNFARLEWWTRPMLTPGLEAEHTGEGEEVALSSPGPP